MGATFLTALNARERTADEPGQATQTQQSTQAAQPAGELSPDAVLRSAFSFDDLKSARFAGGLTVDATGPKGESASIDAVGAYQAGAEGEIPKLVLNVRLRGLAGGLNAGFVSLGDRAFFTRDEVGYEIPRDVWQEVRRSREQGASPGGSQVPLPVDPRTWLRGVESSAASRSTAWRPSAFPALWTPHGSCGT